jgi:hypothetical protein
LERDLLDIVDADEQHLELAMDGMAVEANAMRNAAERGVPLADFEDENGQLPHDHQEVDVKQSERMAARGKTVPCRVCGEPANRYGMYAGLCEEHRNGKAERPVDEPLPSAATKAELPPPLPELLEEETEIELDDDYSGDPLVEATRAVVRARVAFKAAVVNLRDVVEGMLR